MAVGHVGCEIMRVEHRTQVMMTMRRHFLHLNSWIPWGCEVLVALLIIGGLGGIALPRLHGAMEWAGYRSAIREVTNAIDGMRWRALSQHRTFELRIDPAQRSFQLVALESRPRRGGIVEQVIWLPHGLTITEAPAKLTIEPNGRMSPAHITISAPAYNRAFHLMTDQRGAVRFDEEPML